MNDSENVSFFVLFTVDIKLKISIKYASLLDNTDEHWYSHIELWRLNFCSRFVAHSLVLLYYVRS